MWSSAERNPDAPGRSFTWGFTRIGRKLETLMKDFNVYRCVIDGMPETDKARAFAKKFPGRVYLNFYNEHQKGSYKWNEEDLTVSSNRTESLDASQKQILGVAGEPPNPQRSSFPGNRIHDRGVRPTPS